MTDRSDTTTNYREAEKRVPWKEWDDDRVREQNEGSEGNSQTECWSSFSDRPPTKREYAVRKYHGIAPGGRLVPDEERPTQQELADELGVSRTAIDRWVNDEPIPILDGWSERERLVVFSCVMTQDRDALERYFELQQVLDEVEPSPEVEVEEDDGDEFLFEGFDEDWSPW